MQIGVQAQQAVANRRIFVVDEDEINRAALQFMLADEYETHEFGSVAAAMARGAQCPPDLALLGCSLVSREGAALIEGLRGLWSGVKLLAVCETPDIACVAAAKATGADDALAQPFRLETVRRKVERLLLGATGAPRPPKLPDELR